MSGSATLAARSLSITPIEPGDQATLVAGRYQTSGFTPTLAFTLPSGWFADIDQPDALELVDQGDDPTANSVGSLNFAHVQTVLDGPCLESNNMLIGSRPLDLVEWLQKWRWVKASNPSPINVSGHIGLSVDIEIVLPKAGVCLSHPENPALARRVFLFPIAGSLFHMESGDRARVVVLDVAGTALTAVVEGQADTFGAMSPAAEGVIQSLAFP